MRAGAFGDIGCFSFYPGKNLGACGEGGAVTTSDAALADRIRSLRDWGQEGKYNHVRHGFNYRMDGVQGAALGVKLRASRRLDRGGAGRSAPPTRRGSGRASDGRRPIGADHACHVYAILADDRDALRAELQTAGVATGIHYPCPVHLQPAYASLGHGAGRLPGQRGDRRGTRCRCRSIPRWPTRRWRR